jgi:hypothetical protein
MTGIRKAKQEEIVEKESRPALTLLLMMGPPMVDGFVRFYSGKEPSASINYMTAHAFTARKAAGFILKNDWVGLANLVYQATFDHMTGFLFMINLAFIFIFGSWLEKKLWGWRYLAFVLLGVFAPWAILYYDVQAVASEKMFVSPMLLIMFIAGGYVAVKPQKPFVPADWVRPSWKIFRQERKIPVMEQYWVSPWVFIIAFIIYACGVNLAMGVTKNQIVDLPYSNALFGQAHRWVVGRIDQAGEIAAFSWLAAFATFGAGAISAPLMLQIRLTSSARRSGGALQARALQHYKELRTLDMTHDQAVEATSKYVAVPVDIVRDWIAKGQAAVKQEKKF